MALQRGDRLGPYEIQDPLGAGGMGEVYRATDTRLGRDVALKLLPAAFAADAERLARLEREAKVLASLSHPGIAVLHSLEEASRDGAPVRFLTMELAPGEDLAERLKRGPIPVDEAIAIARQVAEALEAAHEKSVVHRDLKPANVKLAADGQAKVLDFGLAKAWDRDAGTGSGSSAELSQSPTLAMTGTAAGIILGTAAYMSPEQARGKPVDKRADVWAFGALVFEMLTGRKLFQGETVSDVLAAVLTREPAWADLPAGTPPRVRRLLERCLERDPKQRLRDIGEARIALAAAGTPEPAAVVAAEGRSRLARLLPWALAVLLAAALAATRLTTRAAPPPHRVAFSFVTEDTFMPMAKVSPDGRTIAYNVSGLGTGSIFLRSVDNVEPRPVPGRLGFSVYFWSPDGRELASGLPGALVAVDVASGSQRTIAEGPRSQGRGGDWGRDGTILYSSDGTIFRVDSRGGKPTPLVEPQADKFSWHGFPLFLPDGRRFAFTSEMREAGENIPAIQVASLDDPKSARVVLTRAMLAGLTRDRLLWANAAGELRATPVDPESFEPSGVPEVVTREVGYDTRIGFVGASVAAGTLVWRRTLDPLSEFAWLDRSGRKLGRLGEPGPWHNFDLSRDGKRVIAATRRQRASASLFLIDTERGVTAPANDSTEAASDPTFSPDGTRIAYRVRNTLLVRAAQGGPETVLLNAAAYPDSWSRDGRFLAVGMARLGSYDAYVVEVDKPDQPPVLLVKGSPGVDEPRFSPDGRWVAFHAFGSGGIDQVSVVPYPPTGERWQISGEGGVQPRWSPEGDELYYVDPAGRLMAVAMPGGDPRRAAVPRALFETPLRVSNTFDQFAVASKDRFLFRLPFGEDPQVPVHVIVGWHE